MTGGFLRAAAAMSVFGGLAFATTVAGATPQHHGHKHHAASHGVLQPLVSDGGGTAFGFHRDPLPYRVGARLRRYRQADAVHQAVVDDALTSGGYYGFPGDDNAGEEPYSSYGVFQGADGYGSPFFAGFYGPAQGTSYGPFGRSYDN